MRIDIDNLVGKVRIALDEIVKDADDTFAADLDTEIRQALSTALTQLAQELPVGMLIGKSLAKSDLTPAQWKNTDGSGYIVLPPDWLRFVELKLRSWQQTLTELLEPTSDEAKRQASLWTRGTPQKPRGMEAVDRDGNKVLRYWSAGKYRSYTGVKDDSVYDHEIESLVYIPSVDTTGTETDVEVPFKESALDYIIYRAAALVLIGKKEDAHAQTYWQKSQVMAQPMMAEE